MIITFYKFNKRMNSTKRPSNAHARIEVNFTYKEFADLHNPRIVVSANILTAACNYASINNTFYFINKVSTMGNNLWEVELLIDLLATYKTQILATNALVEYSDVNYNKDLIDTRLPMDGKISMASTSADVVGYPYINGTTAGCFALVVVGYIEGTSITVPPHGTFTVTYFLSPAQMQQVVKALQTPDFLDYVIQYFQNPFDGIVECYWLPFDVSQYTVLSSATVKICGYELNVDGNTIIASVSFRAPTDLVGRTLTLEIPWMYDDYRNLSPYTTMDLFLPGVGNVNLPTNNFYGETSLSISYILDWSTGALEYEIYKGNAPTQSIIMAFSANIKTNIPIAQSQSFVGKLAQSAISATAGALFMGMPNMMPAAVTSFAGASSVLISRQETKQNGSFNNSFLVGNIGPLKAVLTIRSNNVSDEPGNVAAILGRPCFKHTALSNFSGYVKTNNASVSIDGYHNETIEINNLLNGGVYIE